MVDEEVVWLMRKLGISDWSVDGSGDGFYCCAGFGWCGVFPVYFV